MTLKDALVLLDHAPCGDVPARLNKNITQLQAVEIVKNAIRTFGCPKGTELGLEDEIDSLMEKRVYQVSRNQSRPTY
jgi:hypothetical protein